MRTKGGAGGRPSLHLAIPDHAGYEALQSMLTGEYTEESTGARTIRQSGGKDRHSKVFTSRGPRDRRVRLSVSTAIRFYDLQDRLGLEQPSKAVEWLLLHCQPSIKALPRLGSLHRQQPPSPSSAPSMPASLPLYQAPHFKPPIHDRRNPIDSHTHLHKSLLQHLNQTAPACGLQSASPSVIDTAHANAESNPGGPLPPPHPSSSAGSSSKATASFSTQISNDRAEEANIGSQSYSLHAAFTPSSTPFPCLSRKRRMPASECFSGVLDHSQTNDYFSFLSDVNGSTANCAVFPGNDKCTSTQTTLERLLAAAAFYDDSPTSLSSHSTAIYASLLPPASHTAVHNNAASNFPFLSTRRSDTEIGSSLQGVQEDINAIQAVVPERLKTAPAADPKAYMEQLPQLQARRSNALDATLMSSDFKVAQSDHSLFTGNASVEDEMMEIFRRSGTKTTNCLSPSESNNIIRNSSILPIINGSNTSKSNNNSNNLVSATALYNGESAEEMQTAHQHKQILSFDWALKHAFL